jgi:hypothetical protein
MTICSDADLSPILAGVIIQAIKDLRGKAIETRLDAALWLSSTEAETWLVALGIYREPAELLADGRAIIRRLQYVSKRK